MSFDAIHTYYREVERLRHSGGTGNEKSIRFAFQNLLFTYARSKDLTLVPELAIRGRKGKDVYPDGTLKDLLRQDWGYWESKDEYDDLELEITKKFDKGYPNDNILFEDGNKLVLFQNGFEVSRIDVKNDMALDHTLKSFISYQRPEVAEFRKAIELFKADVPKVTEALREMIINVAERENVVAPFSKRSKGESLLEKGSTANTYIIQRDKFLALCKEVINPNITKEDIREMVIQHILTADIFNTIFDEPNFHRENNIAQELNNLVETFFTKEVRNSTLAGIKHYYDTINAKAAQIADHHEKQMFLKVVYETFYKSYDPKKADRLGVVYTPNEIVRFMIDSTDYLLHKHFGKQLEDKNVEILDPATGTGTFICDIIDHISKDKLPYKYKNELHANEVEILPYYIANLNIEFTYKQKMNDYAEFTNLCFVDTLDNMGFEYKDKQDDIFSVTDENAERIKRQNARKISVIIGNPPYNVSQMNSNDQNQNREYPIIDKRIKDTFVKQSNAQKSKAYDMYARFYRWAMDRLHDNGIIAFITNRSFIDSRTFDGFRKIIQDNFDYAYIVDTKSDVRQNPKIAGTTHNVFGIQTGVAIMFLVKLQEKTSSKESLLPTQTKNSKQDNGQLGLQSAKSTMKTASLPVACMKSKTPIAPKPNIDGVGVMNSKTAYFPCRIEYIAMQDEWRKEDKLQWLSQHKLKDLPFDHIQPDKNNNWINLTENDWDEMIAVADKSLKGSNNKTGAIFDLYSSGISTNRDEWEYDFNYHTLVNKSKYFCDFYNSEIQRWNKTDKKDNIASFVDRKIKWTEELENYLKRNIELNFSESRIRLSMYRVFSKQYFYYDRIITHRIYQQDNIFPINKPNLTNTVINVNHTSSKPFNLLVSDTIPNSHINGDALCLPLYRYDQDGKRHDNITDWALAEFRKQYQDQNIVKEDIFHYVYGVLHNPAYRVKYEQNLKRSLPRIPYYEDFGLWAKWGKALMELHLNYETVEPYPLEIGIRNDDWDFYGLLEQMQAYLLNHPKATDIELKEQSDILSRKHYKAKLKADKENGKIILDTQTTLSGIPSEAWNYKLGNRSALEWILDQYKEKKPKDPTIAKLFNTYKFTDYKDKVIDLLKRVTTVSMETMKIVREMEKVT